MDELLQMIENKFGLDADKAKGVVDTVVNFIADKLPQGMGDQLKGFVEGGFDLPEGAEGTIGGLLDKAQDMLGGLTGGDDKA
jgi:hypothetical protein